MGFLDRFRNVPTPTPSLGPNYRSTFVAEGMTRLNLGRRASLSGPNRETQYSVKTLRAKARDEVRNNEYASRYLELLRTNVVGANGFQFQPQVTNTQTGDLDQNVNQMLKKAFGEWSKSASLDGMLSRWELETLTVTTLAQDGECFWRIVKGEDVNDFGIALQFFDPDQLDSDLNRNADAQGGQIVQGVQIDRFGRPEGYWFWNYHPDDVRGTNLRRVYVPANEILHIVRRNRGGRVRGTTWFAPVLDGLGMVRDYLEAESVAANTAAMHMGTVETAPDATSPYTSNNKQETIDFQPGTFVRLQPGEKFNPINYAHPTTQFAAFLQRRLQGIASGLGVSYSSLASDSSQENYASGRIGIITERAFYKTVQNLMIQQLLEKLYPIWLECAIEYGQLPKLKKELSECLNVQWQSHAAQWADPLREVKSYETSIAGNLISKTQVCALAGLDYREVLDQRYEEMKIEAEYAKALHEAGLAPYLNQITTDSPAIVEAKPTTTDNETTSNETSTE